MTHQRTDNPVVWHSRVVANRVDDPPGDPDGADYCGYDGVEEAGQEENGEEEGDPLQGVLVHPLVAVEHLLRVAVHCRQLHLVLRPGLADQQALDEGNHVGGKDHEKDVAIGLVQQAGNFFVQEAEDGVKVELPTMYSDTEQMFNCYQRVHQNTLERIPLFLAILLLAGLFNSIIAAVIGAIWVAGRVIYSVGYYSGVPNNRIVGSLMNLLTESALLIMVLLQGGQMADWWNIDQSWAAY